MASDPDCDVNSDIYYSFTSGKKLKQVKKDFIKKTFFPKILFKFL